jgi:hypothetical protein
MNRVRALVTALALIPLFGARVGDCAGALPAAPFELRVVPADVREGDQVSVRLDPVWQGSRSSPEEPFDIYLYGVHWGRPEVRYLTPTGVWSKAPTAYWSSVSRSDLPPTVAAWRQEGPIGWLTLVVLFRRASADPRGDPRRREDWIFQPILTKVRVAPAETVSWRHAADVVGTLALLTLAACVLVLLYGRRDRAGPP